jgi:hypothetical protein
MRAIRVSRGEHVHQKPKLVRGGTFRELTLFGMGEADCDGGSVWGMGGQWRCPVTPLVETGEPSGGGW